jgi:hypothetical protein
MTITEGIAAMPRSCRFYLVHQLTPPSCDEKWSLYLPADLA